MCVKRSRASTGRFRTCLSWANADQRIPRESAASGRMRLALECVKILSMSVSAAHASAFYREAIANGEVWAIRDEAGFPAPQNGEGKRSMPFWSLRSRAEKIVHNVPAYEGLRWSLFRSTNGKVGGCPVWQTTASS